MTLSGTILLDTCIIHFDGNTVFPNSSSRLPVSCNWCWRFVWWRPYSIHNYIHNTQSVKHYIYFAQPDVYMRNTSITQSQCQTVINTISYFFFIPNTVESSITVTHYDLIHTHALYDNACIALRTTNTTSINQSIKSKLLKVYVSSFNKSMPIQLQAVELCLDGCDMWLTAHSACTCEKVDKRYTLYGNTSLILLKCIYYVPLIMLVLCWSP